MLVNRYNSPDSTFYVVLKDLNTYKNWLLSDYIDSLRTTIHSDSSKAFFGKELSPGDGRLLSIWPVVQYGGTITANETITSNITLNDKMTIASGCTLMVNSIYNIEDTITVQSGGSLVTGSNANLIFSGCGALIINGTLVSDSSDFNFYSVTDSLTSGIMLNAGSSANINYSNISNADYGIHTYQGALTLSNSEISDCQFGIYAEEAEPDIENNLIQDCTYGIRLENADYQEDEDESDIIENIISYDALSMGETFGIYLYYSSPDIKGNTITGYTKGIYCLNNSSPELGERNVLGCNEINDNDIGIYSDNSFPFLGKLSTSEGGSSALFDNEDYNISAVRIPIYGLRKPGGIRQDITRYYQH